MKLPRNRAKRSAELDRARRSLVEQDARDIDRACKGKGMSSTKGQTRAQGRAHTRHRRDLGFESFRNYTPALTIRPMKSWVRI